MLYYYKLFVLIIATWSYNCLLSIIIISYLKLYICEQTNDYNQIEIISIQLEYLKQYNCVQICIR